MRRLLVAVLVLSAVAAAPASARVLDAKSVLPPGQSGFVPVTGILSGTGSPHLTDQTALWTDFKFKSALFDQPGQGHVIRPGVRIVRDTYGVPTIKAESDFDAWWGVGYAVAEDRLTELELFRRATSGRLAEVLGDEYLDDDLIARRDYYTDGEIDVMIRNTPPLLLRRFEAYRDGINAYVRHVKADPLEIPGEFPALLTPLPNWTLRDSFRIGVFLARTVPQGDGAELRNAQALKELGPKAFAALLPLRTPGRIPTVPVEDGKFPSQPGRTRKQEVRAYKRSQQFLDSIRLPSARATAAAVARSRAKNRIIPRGGSYMWGIGRKLKTKRICKTRRVKGKRRKTCVRRKVQNRTPGNAFVFNGPQLGFQIPELFVEFELHYPGRDLRGVSAPGIPVVGIGHNGRVAWGFTSGLSDTNDLYAEQVTGKETYRYKGQSRRMECRDERFTWRASPTGLGDLITQPSRIAGAKTERICRTVHGPVQETAPGVAYARRYATWGNEIDSLVGLSGLNDAASVREVDRALLNVTWNENVIAVDDRGDIGYWHPGLHPLRPLGYDERLPYPGTGEAEWRGFLPRRKDPYVINPRQGFLFQWNNVPSIGWTNGDGEARERATGPFHRVRLIRLLAGRVVKNPSFDASTALDRTTGATAQQRAFFTGQLKRTRRRAAGAAAALLDTLLAWDGNYDRVNGAGTVDPGVAAWEEFKKQAAIVAIHDLHRGSLGPGARDLSGSPGSSHEFDITNGEAYAFRVLKAGGLRVAAERAAAELAKRFRTSSPAGWREPRRMYDMSAQGAAAAPDLKFFDRGTFQHSVGLGP
jgi:penicillin amidase